MRRVAIGRGQKGMQGCHHLRAFADGRSDPFDRTRPDVADGKDPRMIFYLKIGTDRNPPTLP